MTVQVSAVPGNCVLSIDGAVVGAMPHPRLLIAVGTHTFKFDWSAIGEGSKEVTRAVRNNNQRIAEQSGGNP